MISKHLITIGSFTLIASCAATPAQHHLATTAPTEIHLADATALEDLQIDGVTINLTDKLEAPETNQSIYFGEADVFDSDDAADPSAAVPLIATHNSAWKAITLDGSSLTNAGWKYVGAGPGRHEIWGVLDTSAGDSREQFVLAHSTDGGDHFKLITFTKPCKLATMVDFAMSRDGHGRVTVSLDTDCGSHKSGLYHYETTDDGKHWATEPRYEPDAMIRAQTVPDDEQPDDSHPANRTLFKHRADSAAGPLSIRFGKSR